MSQSVGDYIYNTVEVSKYWFMEFFVVVVDLLLGFFSYYGLPDTQNNFLK